MGKQRTLCSMKNVDSGGEAGPTAGAWRGGKIKPSMNLGFY